MIYHSKCIIKFSITKEEILNDIDQNIYKTFFNWENKKFGGDVSDHDFKVTFLGRGIKPYFKGKFIKDENDIELLITYGKYDTLFIIAVSIFCMIYMVISDSYIVKIIFLIIYMLILLSIAFDWTQSKNNFFKYLKNLDKNCEIIPIK